ASRRFCRCFAGVTARPSCWLRRQASARSARACWRGDPRHLRGADARDHGRSRGSTFLEDPPSACEEFGMRELSVPTLVTLDGVIQDPGGFGETQQGGWGNPYFTEDAQQDAYEHLMASGYILCGRVTHELLFTTWAKIKGEPYLDRMNSISKLVASR